jgi:hypothetical protein
MMAPFRRAVTDTVSSQSPVVRRQTLAISPGGDPGHLAALQAVGRVVSDGERASTGDALRARRGKPATDVRVALSDLSRLQYWFVSAFTDDRAGAAMYAMLDIK